MLRERATHKLKRGRMLSRHANRSCPRHDPLSAPSTHPLHYGPPDETARRALLVCLHYRGSPSRIRGWPGRSDRLRDGARRTAADRGARRGQRRHSTARSTSRRGPPRRWRTTSSRTTRAKESRPPTTPRSASSTTTRRSISACSPRTTSPAGIIVNDLKKDFNTGTSDGFRVILDTFPDGATATSSPPTRPARSGTRRWRTRGARTTSTGTASGTCATRITEIGLVSPRSGFRSGR